MAEDLKQVFHDEMKILPDSVVNNYTHQFLKEFGWDYRNHNEDMPLSEEEYMDIYSKFYDIQKKDFSFKGSIPYISLMNVLGIKNKLINQDDDALLTVVAPPGKGKSSLSMTLAKFIDETLEVDRVIFTQEELDYFLDIYAEKALSLSDDFKKGKNRKNKDAGKVIVLDEGVYMLFSGDAQTKQGKKAQKLFSIIRALNLILIVNVTNYKKINKGVIDGRIAGMFKIDKKGHLKFLSKKKVESIRKRNNELVFPKENFSEKVGYIDKNCKFWREYEKKKFGFISNALKDGKGDENEEE